MVLPASFVVQWALMRRALLELVMFQKHLTLNGGSLLPFLFNRLCNLSVDRSQWSKLPFFSNLTRFSERTIRLFSAGSKWGFLRAVAVKDTPFKICVFVPRESSDVIGMATGSSSQRGCEAEVEQDASTVTATVNSSLAVRRSDRQSHTKLKSDAALMLPISSSAASSFPIPVISNDTSEADVDAAAIHDITLDLRRYFSLTILGTRVVLPACLVARALVSCVDKCFVLLTRKAKTQATTDVVCDAETGVPSRPSRPHIEGFMSRVVRAGILVVRNDAGLAHMI